MYKQRITNGFSEKSPPSNPLSLHSLLRNYIDSASVPKSFKDVVRNNGNIENGDNVDEQEFNGLIKGLRLKASKNEFNRKNSLDMI